MDVFYACDPKWWEANPLALKHPCEQKWTQDKKRGPEMGLKVVSGSSGKALCKKPNHIHFGSNSGYQLINLAWHFGIRKFILLGYNMDVPAGKQQHFFGVHPKGLNQSNNYRGFVNNFATIAAEDKQRIINCTYPTMLTGFAQMPLEEALGEPRSSQPEQSTAEEPALPGTPGRAYLPGVYGGPRSDRADPDPLPIRHFIPCAYGGPVQSIHHQ